MYSEAPTPYRSFNFRPRSFSAQNLNLKAYEEALKAAGESRSEERAAETVSRDRAADMASRFERGEVPQLDEDAETRRRREEDAALFREAGERAGDPPQGGVVTRPAAARLMAISPDKCAVPGIDQAN